LRPLRELALACPLGLAAVRAQAADETATGNQVFRISVTSHYNTQDRQPQIIREFLAAHPEARLVQWDGIRMLAEGACASLAMAMAANIGPAHLLPGTATARSLSVSSSSGTKGLVHAPVTFV